MRLSLTRKLTTLLAVVGLALNTNACSHAACHGWPCSQHERMQFQAGQNILLPGAWIDIRPAETALKVSHRFHQGYKEKIIDRIKSCACGLCTQSQKEKQPEGSKACTVFSDEAAPRRGSDLLSCLGNHF